MEASFTVWLSSIAPVDSLMRKATSPSDLATKQQRNARLCMVHDSSQILYNTIFTGTSYTAEKLRLLEALSQQIPEPAMPEW